MTAVTGVPAGFANGPTSPSAYDAFGITPNDTNDLVQPARALYVGVAGDISLDTLRGTHVTFSNVGVGIFPIGCTKVYLTGTNASGLRGLV